MTKAPSALTASVATRAPKNAAHSSGSDWAGRWGPFLVPVVALTLWAIAYLLIGDTAMAAPWQVGPYLVSILPTWMPDILATLRTLGIAFVAAASVGVVTGFAIGLSKYWTKLFTPIILALYSIPKITLYPIFLIIFGLSESGRVVFSAFHGVFPVLILTMEATRKVPEIYLKVARSLDLNFWQIMRHVLIPHLVPQLVVGLRLCFSLCFLGLIVAELFASYHGLGYRLGQYMTLGAIDAIFALIVVVIVVAVAGHSLFFFWQRRLRGGHDAERDSGVAI